MLRVDYSTAWNLVNTGQLKAMQIGRRWKVTQAAIDAFVRLMQTAGMNATVIEDHPRVLSAYSSMSSTDPTPTEARSCAVISLSEIVSA